MLISFLPTPSVRKGAEGAELFALGGGLAEGGWGAPLPSPRACPGGSSACGLAGAKLLGLPEPVYPSSSLVCKPPPQVPQACPGLQPCRSHSSQSCSSLGEGGGQEWAMR